MLVRLPAEIVSGAPELQLITPPSCQRSTIRDNQPGAELNSRLLGPNGSSNVPLLVRLCVRWNPRTLLSRLRLFGSRVATLLSSSERPIVLLHVYPVRVVMPLDRRLVTCNCMEW